MVCAVYRRWHTLVAASIIFIIRWLAVTKAAVAALPSLNLMAINATEEENLVIPAYIPPRRGIFSLQNVYGFSNVCHAGECGDFHVVAYYVDSSSCVIRVRRLDDKKWDFDVSVYIQSLPYKSDGIRPAFTREVFYLGESNTSYKSVLVNTTIPLRPNRSIHQRQLIPKSIIQTFSTRKASGIYHWNAFQTFVELNPEYAFRMFTDRECRQFIRSHMPSPVLDAYDLLISPTFKADIFRYSYLAIHGGCYFDHKMISRIPLHSVIRPNDTLLVCSDASPSTGLPPNSVKETERIYNAVICSQPGDDRIWKTIQSILDRVASRHSEGSDLSLTGPIAFYQAIKYNISEENVRFKHGVRMKSIMQIRRKYEDYYVKEKLNNQIFLTKFYKGFYADPKNRYGTLWKARTIYYDLLLQHLQWKVFAYPGQRRCIRPEYTASGSIVLKLMTTNAFYEPQGKSNKCQYIKVVIVNDESSEEYRVEIPSAELSNNNRYTLQLPFF